MDLEAEELALGNWPRRLLHVPTLTSHMWQPGNTYNGIHSPTYNAITYTWGRYQLSDTERSDIQAVPITIEDGGWQIPRIDDEHFSKKDFENAIQTAGTYTPPDEPCSVEFLWLDIACIDQGGNDPRSAAEIGRQAMIFNGARTVFVWLTSKDRSELELNISGMCRHEDSEVPNPPQLQHLESIMSDRWFSSLWTLQEAWLRGSDALLLSRDGSLVSFPSELISYPSGYVDFWWLCSTGTFWFHESSRLLCDEDEHDTEMYLKFIEVLMKRGLYHIHLRTELALYDAVRNRVTSRPEDRIYGIQQIFGLRVAKSAISADTGKHFTVTEVEDQFGEQMLQHFPVLSQAHTFVRHVPASKRWRFRDEALMIAMNPSAQVSGIRGKGGADVLCRFWVDQSSSDRRAIYWKGPLTSLCTLRRSMDRLLGEEVFHFTTGYQPPCLADGQEGGMLRIILDCVEDIRDLNGVGNNATMEKVYEGLEQRFPGGGLKVLALGPQQHDNAGQMFGILLVKNSSGDWERLGTCGWMVPLWAESQLAHGRLSFLQGQGEIWQDMQGIFGYFG